MEDNCFDIQMYDDNDSYDRLARYCLGIDISIGDAAPTITDAILTSTKSSSNVSNAPVTGEYSELHLKATDNLHWVFVLDWNNP